MSNNRGGVRFISRGTKEIVLLHNLQQPTLNPAAARAQHWLSQPRERPQRSHSHMLASFHSAKLLPGDLPSEPMESHAGYTQRGRVYVIKAGRVSVWTQVSVIAGSTGVKRQTWVSSQAIAMAAHFPWRGHDQSSEDNTWYSQSQVLGGWQSEVLQPTRAGGPIHIGVQMEPLSQCPDLWF